MVKCGGGSSCGSGGGSCFRCGCGDWLLYCVVIVFCGDVVGSSWRGCVWVLVVGSGGGGGSSCC